MQMKYSKKRTNNNFYPSGKSDGFTIIELMIATTIFSFIMLIATAGIIRIGHLYYAGLTETKTQEVTRAISDELGRSVQFANGSKVSLTDTDNIKSFCLGDTRYTALMDVPYKEKNSVSDNTPSRNPSGLWAEKLSPAGVSCNCPSTCVTETKQLAGVNMRILKFQVEPASIGSDKAWKVNLRLAYGDSDLLSHYDDNGVVIPADKISRRENANCKSGRSGASFCAVALLDTVVKKRLN